MGGGLGAVFMPSSRARARCSRNRLAAFAQRSREHVD